jgi:hypothetical protein
VTGGQPSRTAERVAMRRAAHQLLDSPPTHDDPPALAILGTGQAAAIRAGPRRFENSLAAPYPAPSRENGHETHHGISNGNGLFCVFLCPPS